MENKENNQISQSGQEETLSRHFKDVWIPKELYLNKELSWTEKILLIEIQSLGGDNYEQGCFAGNEYFAKFLDLSVGRIANIITNLKQLDYLQVVTIRNKKRYLFVNLFQNKNVIQKNCNKSCEFQDDILKDFKNENHENVNFNSRKRETPYMYNNTVNNNSSYEGKNSEKIKKSCETQNDESLKNSELSERATFDMFDYFEDPKKEESTKISETSENTETSDVAESYETSESEEEDLDDNKVKYFKKKQFFKSAKEESTKMNSNSSNSNQLPLNPVDCISLLETSNEVKNILISNINNFKFLKLKQELKRNFPNNDVWFDKLYFVGERKVNAVNLTTNTKILKTKVIIGCETGFIKDYTVSNFLNGSRSYLSNDWIRKGIKELCKDIYCSDCEVVLVNLKGLSKEENELIFGGTSNDK